MSEVTPNSNSSEASSSEPNASDRSSVIERPSSFGRRWLAMIVDHLLLAFCQIPTMMVLWILVGGTLVSIGKNIKMGADPQSLIQGGTVVLVVAGFFIATVMGMIVSTVYYGWFNRNKGGSPGKLFMDLRVKDETTGGHLTYGQSFLRDVFWKSGVPTLVSMILGAFAVMLSIPPFVADLFNLMFWMVFMVGFLMAAFRKDKKAFHDLLFGTRVVHRLEMRGS